jgi:hypothetical protein
VARRPPLAVAVKFRTPRADYLSVLVEGFPVALGVIVGIIVAVTGAFAFSMLDAPKHQHHAPPPSSRSHR